MQQLTTLDAQFLAIESATTYGHVGGLAVYDPATAPGGELTLRDICRVVGERLHLLPPFRRRLVPVPLGIDLAYWIEDPEFDIDFHIRESAVPPPGTDQKLAETVAEIFARPLDRAHPLWELYLIHGLEGGRSAVLTKHHHSVADGVSGAEILSILLDQSPEGRELPDRRDHPAGERVPNSVEMLVRGALGVPRQPLRALRSIPSALPNLTDLPGASAFPAVPTLARGLSRLRGAVAGEDTRVREALAARAPRTRFNAPISPHRRFAFGSVSLDSVKAIKNELGITVNDVIVALCASGVRDWLEERGELPDEPLVAMIPISVRSEEERGAFGNRVTTMVVPIPTNEPDPRRRLLRTHELLMSAKERQRAVPANLLVDATSFIPPAVGALAARTVVGILSRTRPPLNLVISNVPGPREPLYFAGALLEAHYPVSAIADGVGLNMTVMSYRDHVDFGIVADREQVDEIWSLMDRTTAALEELESVICGRRPKAAAAAEPARA